MGSSVTSAQRAPAAGKSPFGELLTRLRTQRGMTQEGLASATKGDPLSPRSITNYERRVASARNWVLPHRPGLRSLCDALELDPSERRALAEAWNETRSRKEAAVPIESTPGYVPQGREPIVRQILDAWEIAENGRPQFVLLGGDSGIGKTTIARHVCDVIAASTSKVMVTWGEAHSWATPVEPYLSVRHATDRMLVPPPPTLTLPGLYPNRPTLTDSLRQRVVQSIPQLGGVLISERVIRTMAEDSEAIRTAALNSVEDLRGQSESFGRWDEYANLLISMARTWPIVMVLEDIHWASDLTIALLHHLVHHLGKRSDTQLLVLGTYRSNELFRQDDASPHPLAQFLKTTANNLAVQQIHMGETLQPDQGTSFIRGLVGSLPVPGKENEDALVQWLYPRTSGQPMLTLELIRHLRESGGLVRLPHERGWRFEPEQVPAGLSPAISTLFAQRLAHVGVQEKLMLEVAAAMGESILPEIMATVLHMDEETLLDRIEAVLLQRHELLLPGDMVSMGQRMYSTYRFPHALLREYIYREIQPIRRRRIHLDIAKALSSAFADTDYVAMGEITQQYVMAEAWHSAQVSAYRMAQLNAGRLDWELATVWFDYAEQLATRAQDPQQLWRTRAARLAVLRGLEKTEEALELGSRILHQAEMHNWPSTLGVTYHHLGEVYFDRGQLDRAIELITRASEFHERENEIDLAAAAQAMLSHITYRQGKYDVARAHALRALTHSQEIHNSWVRSEALLAAANCDVDVGLYREAIDNYTLAIEVAEMSGKLSNQYLPSLNIGLCLTLMGEHAAAVEHLTRELDRIANHRVPRIAAGGYQYLGFALEELGQLEAARDAFATSAQMRRQHTGSAMLYDSLAGLLSIAIQLNDDAAVKAHLDEIVQRLEESGTEGMEDPPLVLLTVARGYRHLGDENGYWQRLREAHARITTRAMQIADPNARASYLTRVPANVDILRRYNEGQNA